MPTKQPFPVVDCSGDKIRTKQSFRNECDINQIMRKYRRTGQLTPAGIAARQVVFADVSEIGDYQECQQKIKDADFAFATLSAEVRSRFNNDPGELLDFCADSANKEEAIQLGIIQKVEEPETPPEPPPEPPATPPEGT